MPVGTENYFQNSTKQKSDLCIVGFLSFFFFFTDMQSRRIIMVWDLG